MVEYGGCLSLGKWEGGALHIPGAVLCVRSFFF